MMNDNLLFCFLFAIELLSTTGSSSPPVRVDILSAEIPFSTKYAFAASARRSPTRALTDLYPILQV